MSSPLVIHGGAFGPRHRRSPSDDRGRSSGRSPRGIPHDARALLTSLREALSTAALAVLPPAAFRAVLLRAVVFRAPESRAVVFRAPVVWMALAMMGLTQPVRAQASDVDPASSPELESGGDSDGSPPTLDLDDFSVPDDASFEPLWDPNAYPDLSFTSPGYTLDVAFGRQSNELGSHWFLGAFVALPLGRPPEARSTLYPALASVPVDALERAQPRTADRLVAPHDRPVSGGRTEPTAERARGAGPVPRGAAVPPNQRAEGGSVGAGASRGRGDRSSNDARAESGSVGAGASSSVSAEASSAESANSNGETPRDHGAVASLPPASLSPASVSAEPAPFSAQFLAELITRVRAQSGSQEAIQRLEGMSRRERQSGLLPELRLRGAYGIDQSLALETVGSFSGEATSRGGSDSVVEARLTFHLDRLLAPQGATSFERMRHAVLKTEQEHVDQALELLAAVVEGEALAAAPDLDEVDRIKAQTRASSARARLHVLTGGWFPLR